MSRAFVASMAYRRGYHVSRHFAYRRAQLLERYRVDLVLDVGAAVGNFGVQLRRFGYQGDIVSFEPLTRPYRSLSARAADDPRWTALQLALGDEAGEATINVAGNSDSSSLLPMARRVVESAPHAAYVDTERVTVARLDDVPLPSASRAGFLKIDAQGFERSVLDGAAATLNRLLGVQIELSLVELYEGGMLYDEAVARLRGAGFTLMGLEQGFLDARTGQLLQVDGLFFRD